MVLLYLGYGEEPSRWRLELLQIGAGGKSASSMAPEAWGPCSGSETSPLRVTRTRHVLPSGCPSCLVSHHIGPRSIRRPQGSPLRVASQRRASPLGRATEVRKCVEASTDDLDRLEQLKPGDVDCQGLVVCNRSVLFTGHQACDGSGRPGMLQADLNVGHDDRRKECGAKVP
jgi:hypothetical protein